MISIGWNFFIRNGNRRFRSPVHYFAIVISTRHQQSTNGDDLVGFLLCHVCIIDRISGTCRFWCASRGLRIGQKTKRNWHGRYSLASLPSSLLSFQLLNFQTFLLKHWYFDGNFLNCSIFPMSYFWYRMMILISLAGR